MSDCDEGDAKLREELRIALENNATYREDIARRDVEISAAAAMLGRHDELHDVARRKIERMEREVRSALKAARGANQHHSDMRCAWQHARFMATGWRRRSAIMISHERLVGARPAKKAHAFEAENEKLRQDLKVQSAMRADLAKTVDVLREKNEKLKTQVEMTHVLETVEDTAEEEMAAMVIMAARDCPEPLQRKRAYELLEKLRPSALEDLSDRDRAHLRGAQRRDSST